MESCGTGSALGADGNWKDPVPAVPLILGPVCSCLAPLHTVIGEKVAISPLSLGVKALLGEQLSPAETCVRRTVEQCFSVFVPHVHYVLNVLLLIQLRKH